MVISYENIKKLAQENQYKLKYKKDKKFKRIKKRVDRHIKKCAKNGYTDCSYEFNCDYGDYYAELFKNFYKKYGFRTMVIWNKLHIYWD